MTVKSESPGRPRWLATAKPSRGSRAKDDPTDAEYAAELLHQHRDRLTAWTPDDAATRTIQWLVEQRRRLINDRTRFSNRLTAVLKSYFPQALTWLPDLCTDLPCAFLTRWRYFCPKFLRQTFVEFAGQSIPFCGWARAFYHLQRSKGKGHAAALRALAFKWIRIIWKCWQTRTPYDEARYLAQLRKQNRP